MFNLDPKSAAIKNAMAKRRYNTVYFFEFFNIRFFGKLDFLKKLKFCDDLILLNDQNDVIKAKKVKVG